MGAKCERHEDTGWEIQPNLRLLFTPTAGQSYWAAVSRAVRTPDRTSDFRLRLAVLPPDGAVVTRPAEVVFQGNHQVVAEELVALEAGGRWQLAANLRLELSLFQNQYDKLVNFGAQVAPSLRTSAYDSVYLRPANQAAGRTTGGELDVTWQVGESWRLTASGSYLHMALTGPGLPFLDNSEGQNPTQMFTLHSAWDLNRAWRLDVMARHMGSLPSWQVPAYEELDLQVTWQLTRGLAVSLIGRNLLNRDHFEAPSGRVGTPASVVSRSVGLRAQYSF